MLAAGIYVSRLRATQCQMSLNFFKLAPLTSEHRVRVGITVVIRVAGTYM